jgi:putative glutamine amidotransferase
MGARVAVTFGNAKKVEPYEAALRAAGLEPVRLAEPGLDGVSALLLTGGTDVDPCLYHADPAPETDEPDRLRDRLEMDVLRQALAAAIPVFAICRGLQLLNVCCGGTLVQHLDSASLHRQPGRFEAHAIDVVPESRLAAIVGAGPYTVNSRHHQAIDRLGEGLLVTARAGEVVEAVEMPGPYFVLAVQWHPEDRIADSRADRKLFESFAEAATTHSGR